MSHHTVGNGPGMEFMVTPRVSGPILKMDKKARKPGSGRKPIPDRGLIKAAVMVYLENRVIDGLGGKERVKAAMTDFANNVYNQMQYEKNPNNNRASVHSLDA